jgi:hypothetical protein
LTIDHQQEILSVLQNVDRWPAIIFKKNSQIRQMLHQRKCSSSSAYGLYVPSAEEDDHGGNIFMNFQVNLLVQTYPSPSVEYFLSIVDRASRQSEQEAAMYIWGDVCSKISP